MSTSKDDRPRYFLRDEEDFDFGRAVVTRHRIEVHMRGRGNIASRHVFSILPGDVDGLVEDLQTAKWRWLAWHLEDQPITVVRDVDGLLTARQGYVELRRYVTGEWLVLEAPGATWKREQGERRLILRAPRAGSDPSARTVARWNVMEREAYLRLLEALTRAEAQPVA